MRLSCEGGGWQSVYGEDGHLLLGENDCLEDRGSFGRNLGLVDVFLWSSQGLISFIIDFLFSLRYTHWFCEFERY